MKEHRPIVKSLRFWLIILGVVLGVVLGLVHTYYVNQSYSPFVTITERTNYIKKEFPEEDSETEAVVEEAIVVEEGN